MSIGTLAPRVALNRILNTSEMAKLLRLTVTQVGSMCRAKQILGAWRTSASGNWRIDSEDFRKHLVACGKPTETLDDLLAAD